MLLAKLAKARIQERAAKADTGPKIRRYTNPLYEYADRPVEFIRDILGYELEIPLPDGTICDYQAKAARAVCANERVTIRSGQKTGKSLLAILLAIWWVCTRDRGECILTSSSDPQVKNVLWKELHEVNRALKRRGVELLPNVPLDPATGCRWDDGRSMRGFATKTPENAAGISGPALFFILDEASGIEAKIAEAFIGNATGGAKVLALSNPTQTSGFFYETFTTRREFWFQIHLTCYDSPNYCSGQRLVPGLATREAVDEMVRAYGDDSPFVAVRVRGDFPTQVANAVIGLGMLEAATARWDTVESGDLLPSGTLDLGVDVARFGDDLSVVTGRRGLVGYSPAWIKAQHGIESWASGYDSTKVCGLVLLVMRKLRTKGERVRIKLDAAGGYGGAVADRLRELQENGDLDEFVQIIEINVACVSTEPEEFPLLRDEIWFSFREWAQEGGAFFSDPRLESELIAPTYSLTKKAQRKVESKDEIKKRAPSNQSPDFADSFLLAIFDGVATPIDSGEDDDEFVDDAPRWGNYDGRGYG